MPRLPASIENYLSETGFTATEIFVLKKLLEGDAMTLRELAAKTGKSTGVLDQAVKKLTEKGIVHKESINNSAKYAIASLDAMKQWVEYDMDQKRSILKRKQQDFEAFLATVEHEKGRPEMEYFEGVDGVQQAYIKLLQKDAKQWLLFQPCVSKEEESPLREFQVQLFRERRKKGVFLRVLAPNIPLGRRYKSRDIFEYRETHLIPEDDFPVSFEKYIVGDTIASFDIPNNKANFLRFPEMAEEQRKIFSILECRAAGGDEEKCTADTVALIQEKEVDVETRVFSGIREFFMSKKSIGILASVLFTSLIFTCLFYLFATDMMKQEIGYRLMSIAATAAPEIDYRDLERIHYAKDMRTNEYQNIFKKLNEIRESNSNMEIAYVYIMRPANIEGYYIFVADADSNFNLDGGDEETVAPGTFYPEEFLVDEKYSKTILNRPLFEKGFWSDEWGTYISATAPIVNDNGNGVAILGIDMNVESFYKELNSHFKSIVWFIGIFLCGLVLRIAFLFRRQM